MAVVIKRKLKPSGVPVFSVGSPVVIARLKYGRLGIKVGDRGTVLYHYPAGGVWDVRPKDDLYKVGFEGFEAFIYYEELAGVEQ